MSTVEWTDAELNALAMYRHAETHEDAREAENDLAALVEAREQDARAEALREAADAWQIGGWSDDLPPKGASRPQLILGMAQRATVWLRERADRIGGAR